MLGTSPGGAGWEAMLAAQERAGHRSSGGEKLHFCIPCFVYILSVLLLLLSLPLISY